MTFDSMYKKKKKKAIKGICFFPLKIGKQKNINKFTHENHDSK